MTLYPIDWAIIVVYLVGCMVAGIWMRRYVRGVEDFAVAGREMDLNLGIASLAATEMGLVTVMYTAEMGFRNGPAGAVVGVFMAAAMLLVGLTGFVIRPLRDAGVITIPELFQKRFGTRVRWLAGLVVILGGVLNMGIFLQVGGKFLVHVTGMPDEYLKWTMSALLGIVLLYTALGGMISVLVTDYLQFLVLGLGLVVTSVLVVASIGWVDFTEGVEQAFEDGLPYKEGRKAEVERQEAAVAEVRKTRGDDAADALAQEQKLDYQEFLRENRAELAERNVLVETTKRTLPDSQQKELAAATMGHPFNPASKDGLGWMYVVWQAIFQIAVVTTWQTMITRVLSAKDSRTARRVYSRTAFYFVGRFALPGLWGAAAFLYFVNQGGLPEGVDSLTAMPAFLKTLLPWGVIGLLIAAMLAAEMSTDSGYLLTWATVIYNDLIAPVLKRPLSQRARLTIVRLLVLAIGVFLLFYGLWYEIPGNAWDYLAVTGNIYIASVFTLLVGALYWRGANAWGAVAAIVLGAIGPITFLVVNAIVKDPAKQIPPEVAGFASFGLAFAGMLFGSLVGQAFGRPPAASGPATTADPEA